MTIFEEVRCIDCGHKTRVRSGEVEKELEEMCWERKGDGWQCPHCYYRERESIKGGE